MIEPVLPLDEEARLAALESCRLSEEPEPEFDEFTELAASLCDSPVALISLVDEDRQWFKANVGLQAHETPRRVAFCAHAILEPESVLVVPDALSDPRFAGNPLVSGPPHIRFYAGAPLTLDGTHAIGTLCVIDFRPRQLRTDQLRALEVLAGKVVTEIQLRRKMVDLVDLSDELARNQRDAKQFAARAAHDLQGPMRRVQALSAILREELTDSAQVLTSDAELALAQIEHAAEFGSRLVTDLVDLLRLGHATLRPRPASLSECAASAIQLLSSEIAGSGATVHAQELPLAVVDPTLFERVFQNLISNAIKYVADRAPVIEITCERGDGEWVIGVRDNGIGVDPSQQEQVFEPFSRAHTGRRPGSGLGLSVVRSVVERHGGRVWVESTRGTGSHFRFTLTDRRSLPRRCAATPR